MSPSGIKKAVAKSEYIPITHGRYFETMQAGILIPCRAFVINHILKFSLCLIHYIYNSFSTIPLQ